jgi:hypothetical protein
MVVDFAFHTSTIQSLSAKSVSMILIDFYWRLTTELDTALAIHQPRASAQRYKAALIGASSLASNLTIVERLCFIRFVLERMQSSFTLALTFLAYFLTT